MYSLTDIFEGDYPITQTFGANPSYYGQFYIYGVPMKGHEGVDWGTPVGVKILAPFDGVVLRAGWQNDFPNYGNAVCLWDSVQKCAVWYAHLSEVHVAVGNNIKKGFVMGKTGNSGNSTGPHLHFGIVETDANGNRLHQYDGWGGFINPLGSNINWILGKPVVNEWVKKLDKLKIAIDRVKAELDSQMSNKDLDRKSLYEATIRKLREIVNTGSL